jgi:hypothetical protein
MPILKSLKLSTDADDLTGDYLNVLVNGLSDEEDEVYQKTMKRFFYIRPVLSAVTSPAHPILVGDYSSELKEAVCLRLGQFDAFSVWLWKNGSKKTLEQQLRDVMFRLMHARPALANPVMDRALALRVIEKAASKNGSAVTAFVRGLPDAIVDLDFLKLLVQSRWVESDTNALGLSDEFFCCAGF